jgi:multidrug resistance efflux pump
MALESMKGKGLLIGGIVILAAIAAGALAVFRSTQAKPVQQSHQAAPVVTEISVPARLQAATVIEIGVPFEGKIEAFHAEPGDEVYEGQLLAQIRSETLRSAEEEAALDLERVQTRLNNLESSISETRLEASRAGADAARARSELDRASRNFQRQKMLLAEGATPRLTFEKSEREFRAIEVESTNLDQLAKQSEERVGSLQRELDGARKLLQDKSEDLEGARERVAAGDISSPVGGIVAGRRGEVGEAVSPAVRDLFRIATDLSVMEAVAEPAPADLALVKQGQEAFVALAESPHELLPGAVKKVEAGRVTIEFRNPNPAIKPGLTAQVRIKLT